MVIMNEIKKNPQPVAPARRPYSPPRIETEKRLVQDALASI